MRSRHPTDDQNTEKLFLGCENADIDLAREALEAGASLDNRTVTGETALHLAVSSGDSRIVEFLLIECRMHPDLTDAFGRTPLHLAAQKGNLPAVEALVMARADLEAKDQMGVEPRIYAEMSGHRDIIKLFNLLRAHRK